MRFPIRVGGLLVLATLFACPRPVLAQEDLEATSRSGSAGSETAESEMAGSETAGSEMAGSESAGSETAESETAESEAAESAAASEAGPSPEEVTPPGAESEAPSSLGLTAWEGDVAPPGDDPPEAVAYAEGERRERPDLDGRGDPPRDPADGVLWIPRILFSPLYLLSEFAIRRPLEVVVTEIERGDAFGGFFDAFTWEDRKAGILPTAFFDFGFLPSVGLYFFWNDLFFDGNQIRATVGTWGPDWLHADVLDRVQISDDAELNFQFTFFHRQDLLFHGIEGGADGNGTQRIQQGARTRYQWTDIEGRANFLGRYWRSSEVFLEAGVRHNEFDNSNFTGRGLLDGVAAGLFEVPPSFGQGYTAFRYRARASLDTREERPAPGTGLRMQGYFEQGIDLTRPDTNQWIQYGGRAGLYLDTGSQHVLSAVGVVEFADPIQEDPVPFTELVQFGAEPLVMGGFLPGQLRGRSGAVAAFAYTWPIWVWLDGEVFASAGNVFGAHLREFDIERLRLSFGFGFRTVGDRDAGATIGLAFGTDPFDQGANISSVRFVVGSQQGF